MKYEIVCIVEIPKIMHEMLYPMNAAPNVVPKSNRKDIAQKIEMGMGAFVTKREGGRGRQVGQCQYGYLLTFKYPLSRRVTVDALLYFISPG